MMISIELKQAGTELCQYQVMLEVIVEVVVKYRSYSYSCNQRWNSTAFTVGWVVQWLGGWLENWRVMLISTQIVLKVEVDIGNYDVASLPKYDLTIHAKYHNNCKVISTD